MITGIVLAAGSSSRLGRPKQLLDLAGKPVLQHVLDASARSPLDEVLLVLGHAGDAVEGAVTLPPRGRIVRNPAHDRGQATSLRAGLAQADPRSEAAVILLGDQPRIRPEAVRAVVDEFGAGHGPIVQASYGGRPAHPTLLARDLWPDLRELAGDEGARSFIARHRRLRSLVPVEGEPPEDIDTEEDYERVRALFGADGPESS